MKRLYKRDNIMLEILNRELLETVCFNLAASSLSKEGMDLISLCFVCVSYG